MNTHTCTDLSLSGTTSLIQTLGQFIQLGLQCIALLLNLKDSNRCIVVNRQIKLTHITNDRAEAELLYQQIPDIVWQSQVLEWWRGAEKSR